MDLYTTERGSAHYGWGYEYYIDVYDNEDADYRSTHIVRSKTALTQEQLNTEKSNVITYATLCINTGTPAAPGE